MLRAIDRLYAAKGPDEPDLGLNVAYVTTRRALQRLAAARDWEPPASVAQTIHARLQVLESITDPVRLEAELLSFPTHVVKLLDRRRAARQADAVDAGPIPHRRAGDRPQAGIQTV